jgi:hypothetical protein
MSCNKRLEESTMKTMTVKNAITDVIKSDGAQMNGGRQIDAGILRQAVTNKLPELSIQEYRDVLTTMRDDKVLVPCGGTQLWFAD